MALIRFLLLRFDDGLSQSAGDIGMVRDPNNGLLTGTVSWGQLTLRIHTTILAR